MRIAARDRLAVLNRIALSLRVRFNLPITARILALRRMVLVVIWSAGNDEVVGPGPETGEVILGIFDFPLVNSSAEQVLALECSVKSASPVSFQRTQNLRELRWGWVGFRRRHSKQSGTRRRRQKGRRHNIRVGAVANFGIHVIHSANSLA
jgi:hypothetical protein